MTFQDFETPAACVVCGGADSAPTSMADVRRCRSCRVYYRAPRPTQEAIKQSYDLGSNYDRWAEEEAYRDDMWRRRVELITRHQTRGRLLDVGTGDGRFLAAAAQAGFECEGTEISEDGAARARERGFEVRNGQFTELSTPPESFDVVTIWHVLEHVPDPGAVLAQSLAILRPGGWLAVAVPNETRGLLRSRLGLGRGHPFGEMTFGGEIHLTHFQPRTLAGALRRAGFGMVDFGVDYIYPRMTAKTAVLYRLNCLLSATLRWHAAPAMVALARRPHR